MTLRSLWDRLAPARLGKAVMLIVALQLAMTAWTGVLASSDPAQEPVPATFSEPQVRAGDHAVYAVEAGSGEDRPTMHGRPLLAVAVEWDEPRWSITRNGSFRWTMPMEIHLDLDDPARESDRGSVRSAPVGGQDDSRPSRESSRYDLSVSVSYGTDRWVSTGTARTQWKDHVDRYASVGNRSIRDSADKRIWRVDLSAPATPCGFHLPFHGGSTDLDAPIGRVGDCGGTGTLEAVAAEETAGTRSLRLSAGTESPVQVWYAPEIPVPVRWSGPLDALAFPHEGQATLQLSEWGRGDGPAPDDPTGEPPAPWHVDTAPREPWGPAEGELRNVSFPLSEAYDVMTSRSDAVRSFLGEHPDAYTARAWMYRDRGRVQRPRTTWQIVLADGEDHIERFVRRSDPVTVPATGRQVAPPAEVLRRDEVAVDAPVPADRHPTRDQVQDRLPVVSDHAIHANGRAGYAPWETGDAGHYGFSTSCLDARCHEQRTIVEIGTTMAPLLGTPGPKTPWAQNRSAMRFGFTPDGKVAYIEGTGKVGTGPTVAETSGQQSTPPAPAETLEGAPWTFPAEEAAVGISIVAILSGILYYVWPKLKLLGAGFYSRISRDRDEVLDNDVRRKIHEMVQAEPGIHFRELKRQLETGVGILEHHLDKLVRADVLAERRTEAYRCYFPYGTIDREVMEAAPHLRSASAREILQAVEDRPGTSVTGLADATGLSRSTAGYHLDQLAEAGLIDKDREGRSLAVRLTDLGRKAIEDLRIACFG